jgi:hypothetical protein
MFASQFSKTHRVSTSRDEAVSGADHVCGANGGFEGSSWGVGGCAQLPTVDDCAWKETIVKLLLISIKFTFFF